MWVEESKEAVGRGDERGKRLWEGNGEWKKGESKEADTYRVLPDINQTYTLRLIII